MSIFRQHRSKATTTEPSAFTFGHDTVYWIVTPSHRLLSVPELVAADDLELVGSNAPKSQACVAAQGLKVYNADRLTNSRAVWSGSRSIIREGRMSKRGPKKRRKSKRERPRRRPTKELEQALKRAERLIEGGRAQEAVELLTPLVESHRWVADVHYMLGYARVSTGDIWGALGEYERALELSHDPGYWPPLASLYTQMELNAHALKALRQSLRHPDYIPPESYEGMRQALTMMEEVVAQMSHSLGIPVRRVEKGLYEMEEGIRDLNQSDYASSAAASQRAIRVLGNWPPPHNNLSLALFYDGHPEEAVAAARKVLEHDPDNVQALSNAIRFLAWSEREEEARTLGARLEDVEPQDSYRTHQDRRGIRHLGRGRERVPRAAPAG